MRKFCKTLKEKGLVGIVNSVALFTVIWGAQQCCFWFLHQPDFPAEADKYRKYK